MEIVIVVVIAAAAIAAVLYPLLAPAKGGPGESLTEQALNEQVSLYREAIRRGTLCERCLAANPPNSRFCLDCGSMLSK